MRTLLKNTANTTAVASSLIQSRSGRSRGKQQQPGAAQRSRSASGDRSGGAHGQHQQHSNQAAADASFDEGVDRSLDSGAVSAELLEVVQELQSQLTGVRCLCITSISRAMLY